MCLIFPFYTELKSRLTEQLTVVGHLEPDPRYKLHHPHSPGRKGSTKKEKHSNTFALELKTRLWKNTCRIMPFIQARNHAKLNYVLGIHTFSNIGRKASVKAKFKVMICLGEQDEHECDGVGRDAENIGIGNIFLSGW